MVYKMNMYDYNNEVAAMRNLFKAIVFQDVEAYVNAISPEAKSQAMHDMIEFAFGAKKREFEDCCELADLSPDYVRKIFKSLLADSSYLRKIKNRRRVGSYSKDKNKEKPYQNSVYTKNVESVIFKKVN